MWLLKSLLRIYLVRIFIYILIFDIITSAYNKKETNSCNVKIS